MKYAFSTFFICMLALFSAHGQDAGAADNTEILRIGPNQTRCMGYEGQTHCFIYQKGDMIGGKEWSYFYEPLEDFDYEEGFFYTLRVEYHEVEDPAPDEPRLSIQVLEILEQVATEERVYFTR